MKSKSMKFRGPTWRITPVGPEETVQQDAVLLDERLRIHALEAEGLRALLGLSALGDCVADLPAHTLQC